MTSKCCPRRAAATRGALARGPTRQREHGNPGPARALGPRAAGAPARGARGCPLRLSGCASPVGAALPAPTHPAPGAEVRPRLSVHWAPAFLFSGTPALLPSPPPPHTAEPGCLVLAPTAGPRKSPRGRRSWRTRSKHTATCLFQLQVTLLSKFLLIAKSCYEQRNFATAMQILGGLEHLAVRQSSVSAPEGRRPPRTGPARTPAQCRGVRAPACLQAHLCSHFRPGEFYLRRWQRSWRS